MSLLEVENVRKIYSSAMSRQRVLALDDVNFTVESGEFIAIMGESGSGKTTLLNILASLDKPTAGRVLLNGQCLGSMRGKQLSAFRREHLGFVFQDFNLLDTFTNKDNILLPLVLSNQEYGAMMRRLQPVSEALGIQEILEKYPYEVSGGQKQRIAIARALVNQPDLILADEPTGALDSKSSQDVLEIFDQLHEAGQTILMVTHSMNAASHASRVLFIQDGHLWHQVWRGDRSEDEMFEAINQVLSAMRGNRHD